MLKAHKRKKDSLLKHFHCLQKGNLIRLLYAQKLVFESLFWESVINCLLNRFLCSKSAQDFSDLKIQKTLASEIPLWT